MINYRGLYLPDGEKHLIDWMEKVNRIVDGKPTYQYHKLEAAMTYVTPEQRARLAVDVGAHVGLWTMHLAKLFAHVCAFEPVSEHQECWKLNVKDNATLFCHALGELSGFVTMKNGGTSSGDTWAVEGGSIPVKRLDDVIDSKVGLIKIDCEGYELFVLRGAMDMISLDAPVIVIEQKSGHGAKYGIGDQDGVVFLKKQGYVVKRIIAGDFIMVHES